MSSIFILFSAFKFSERKISIMNYLKNRYPFKFLTNIVRIAARTSNALQNYVEVKRNRSDSVQSISVTKSKAPSSKKLTASESCNSLPFSKTSSEHSIISDKKNNYFDPKYDKFDGSRGGKNNLEIELKAKLKKLSTSLNSTEFSPKEILHDESRCGLKRAYPWQNLNLRSISQSNLNIKKLARSPYNDNLDKSSSDHSMATISNPSLSNSTSNQSLRSFKSVSSNSLDQRDYRASLEDIKNQIPLFKSIMKKSDRKSKPSKEVTFNNISSIYTPRTSCSSSKQDQKDNKSSSSTVNSLLQAVQDDIKCPVKKKGPASSLGRYEPLKEENSFLHLYNSKKQKILH